MGRLADARGRPLLADGPYSNGPHAPDRDLWHRLWHVGRLVAQPAQQAPRDPAEAEALAEIPGAPLHSGLVPSRGHWLAVLPPPAPHHADQAAAHGGYDDRDSPPPFLRSALPWHDLGPVGHHLHHLQHGCGLVHLFAVRPLALAP